MPKTELFDKNEAIKKAVNLFWMKGYEATSLSDLTQELGIGKGSFYNTFGSKRKLFDTCLSVVHESGFKGVKHLLNQESDPILGIRRYLEFHSENLLKDPHSKGCLIVNTTAEMAHDKGIKSFLLENNQSMRSIIVDYLRNGPLSERAEIIADSILIYTAGVSVLTKFMNDRKRFKASLDQFMKSIDT